MRIDSKIKKILIENLIKNQILFVLREQQVLDPGLPPDPNTPPVDPTADPSSSSAIASDEGEGEIGTVDGDESPIPEDPIQDIVDKVKEKMDTNEDEASGINDESILSNLAKAYLQDYNLLDKTNLSKAKDLVQKLKSENIPELNKVAKELEKFLAN